MKEKSAVPPPWTRQAGVPDRLVDQTGWWTRQAGAPDRLVHQKGWRSYIPGGVRGPAHRLRGIHRRRTVRADRKQRVNERVSDPELLAGSRSDPRRGRDNFFD